jgi:hypothetical protein
MPERIAMGATVPGSESQPLAVPAPQPSNDLEYRISALFGYAWLGACVVAVAAAFL